MNQNKNLLIGAAVVAGLCLCAGVVVFLVVGAGVLGVSQSFKTDPTSVAAVAHRIADFDIPSGYRETIGMSLLGYDMIGLTPDSSSQDGPIIVMMQFTSGVTDPAQMQQQMEKSLGQQNGTAGTPMQVVETRQETIRGQQVTVTISQGTNQEATTLKRLTAVFKGNAGPTMLMIEGNAAGWDDQVIEDFIHSIR